MDIQIIRINNFCIKFIHIIFDNKYDNKYNLYNYFNCICNCIEYLNLISSFLISSSIGLIDNDLGIHV